MAFTGCVITDDDGETEASTSGNTMTTTMTTAGTADDDGTATMGTMTTPGTGDDTAGTADDTAGDTAGTTAGDTGPGADPTEACLAACEVGAGCEKFDPSECPASCREDLGFAERDGCVSEAVDWWLCIGALDCSQYADWLNEEGDPYPCQAEDEALFACEPDGGDSSSGGGSGDSSSGG